jgi:septal ring factor EnvC (AmiA/AmiB activator)
LFFVFVLIIIIFCCHRSEIVEKDQVIASLRVDLESNQTKLEESNSRISSNESKIAELEGKLSDLSASANAGNDAFVSLKKELADSNQNLAAAQAKLDERDSQISSLQTERIPKLKYVHTDLYCVTCIFPRRFLLNFWCLTSSPSQDGDRNIACGA